MVTELRWPELERKCLGDVVSKCWEYTYENTHAEKNGLILFLNREVLQVDGEYVIVDLSTVKLFSEIQLPHK